MSKLTEACCCGPCRGGAALMECPATAAQDSDMTPRCRNTRAAPRRSPDLSALAACRFWLSWERQPAARTASFGSSSGSARGLRCGREGMFRCRGAGVAGIGSLPGHRQPHTPQETRRSLRRGGRQAVKVKGAAGHCLRSVWPLRGPRPAGRGTGSPGRQEAAGVAAALPAPSALLFNP